MRALIAPELNELDRQSVDFVSLISGRVGPLPPPPPNGAGEIQQTLRRVNEEVGFRKLTTIAAGKQFISGGRLDPIAHLMPNSTGTIIDYGVRSRVGRSRRWRRDVPAICSCCPGLWGSSA